MSLERKIESSIFLCIPRDLNILWKSCTTFVIVKIVRNLSRGRSPCQRVNHVKSGVIYFSAFIYSCIRYYSYVEPGPNINKGSSQQFKAVEIQLMMKLKHNLILNVHKSNSIDWSANV